jgi:hydroxypyruvate isomerase
MSYRDYIKIGLSHYLLYKKFITNSDMHMRTQLEIVKDERFEVLDIWIPEQEPYRSEEIKSLRQSGKEIYYNVGTRKGKEAAHPASLISEKRKYSMDFYKNEIGRGIETGCKKVIVNSGPDVPENREEAISALVDFFCEICEYVPNDVLVMVEPTDRDVDKKKLIGPSNEAVKLVQKIHDVGYINFSSMIDMCHLPLMGESIVQAMEDSKGFIGHIHLGNCIYKDDGHALFGDKHPPWGLKGSEYGVEEIATLIKTGLDIGYFSKNNRGSASFEMLAYDNMSPLKSIDCFFEFLEKAWEKVTSDLSKK